MDDDDELDPVRLRPGVNGPVRIFVRELDGVLGIELGRTVDIFLSMSVSSFSPVEELCC